MKILIPLLVSLVGCSSLSAHADVSPQHAKPLATDAGNYVVRPWQGRPAVWRDGVPLLLPAYCNSIVGWGEPENETRWKSWIDNFIHSGVKVYLLDIGRHQGKYGQSSLWTDDGVYADTPTDEPMSTDKRAEYILSKVPDALFILRPHTYAPEAWMKKNPGELQTDSNGKTYEPSWASEKYLTGLRELLTRFVRYHESRPWRNRIIGYEVIPLGEGYTMLSIEDNFYDRSAAMQAAWRMFLTKKYATDAALRAAWGDAAVSLKTVEVPTDAELRAKIAKLPQWPAAGEMRKERDYALLHKELHARWFRTVVGSLKAAVPNRSVLIGIDALKQPLLGWQIQEAFGARGQGTGSLSMFVASGSFGVGPLMDMPELTNLITPGDYTARHMGAGFEVEGLGDSMVLRGKTLLIENDTRTFLVPEIGPGRQPGGTFNDLKQVRAGFARNTGLGLSRGFYPYWTDIANAGSYYNSEDLQREVRTDKALAERGTAWPHRETQHAVAMIIDDESPLYENFTNGFQQLAVIRQRVEGLATCGIPYRVYLLSDLKKDNFPDYRCYYFPNLFKVDAETLAMLRKKVLKNGHLAIFGPGTGITDGETVTKDGAERLMGIPMRLTEGSSSRRVVLNGANLGALHGSDLPPFYGDSFMYGPILTPEPNSLPGTGVKVLGDLNSTWNVNAPGLVLKDFGRGGTGNGVQGVRGAGDYSVVFSAALPLPASLVRALAAYGGCNVWSEKDAVISASDTIVSLHSARSGAYTIHLPRRVSRVVDAESGKVIGRQVSQIRLRFEAPQTRTFLLE